MATVKVVDLVSRALTLLKDPTAVRWSGTELQWWLNDGYREIITMRPDIYTQTGTFTCAAGARQVISTGFSDAQRLVEVLRNVAAASNKRVVRLTNRKDLDDQRPGWYNETASINIEKYTYDPRLPKEFLTYPPATNTAQLEIIYSTFPAPHTLTNSQLLNSATTEVIRVDDAYANPLLDYMLYRAYSKDAEQANNAQRAAAYYQLMMGALGANTQSGQAIQPGAA